MRLLGMILASVAARCVEVSKDCASARSTDRRHATTAWPQHLAALVTHSHVHSNLLHDSCRAIMLTFSSKRILFDQEPRRLVCQHENGPCPLLAICNALLLQGYISLPAGATEVDSGVLQALLVGYIVDNSSTFASEYDASRQHQIDETIELVQQGRFLQGLDVNPAFGGPERYEFTRELSVFDLCRLRLVHGWVVDSADPSLYRLLGKLSYNEASLAVVTSLEDTEVVRAVSRSLSGSLTRGARRCVCAALCK
jgi:MINDY deubiquitinase